MFVDGMEWDGSSGYERDEEIRMEWRRVGGWIVRKAGRDGMEGMFGECGLVVFSAGKEKYGSDLIKDSKVGCWGVDGGPGSSLQGCMRERRRKRTE